MSERPCDVCKRPRWDGGHALNPRECDQPNGETCRLYAVVAVARKIANVTAGGSRSIVFSDVPDQYGTELQDALSSLKR